MMLSGSGARRIHRLGAVAWLMLAACSGCNRSPFTLAPVSGTVLLDGRPLAGGVINFQPIAAGEGGKGGPGSTSRTDAEGRYWLTTVRGQRGAVVGKHRVKIYSFSPESPPIADDAPAPQRELVPARYNYRSDVTFDVPAGGTDTADFSIKTK